jgi:hypothetical protein
MEQQYPEELNNILGGEISDFVVKAKRAIPLKMALAPLVFGIFWLAFTSIFLSVFIGPVLFGQEVHFESNGSPVTAGPNNLKPLIGIGVFIGVFLLVGFVIVGYGIRSLLAKGAWYIGTQKRMIIYQKNATRSISWEQFYSDIAVSGNNQDGSIALLMKTGEMVSQRSGPDRYVPGQINIVGIQDAFRIGEILRGRIKENNPTLPLSVAAG